ncbi:phage tail tube protein [Demequina gelatinilytica]|uniref:phage tail tube protein n=1 Tax=Demequina gelatinilytica TaxID=1638980 RepID=UPI0007863FDA|nr:phage tail tube protein [Demequina gelatinilytica]
MTTQLDCSIGVKKESVYGTPVVVDRFLEFTEESLEDSTEYGQGEGMRPGQRGARLDRRVVNKIDAGGSITDEAKTKGLGLLLEAGLGGTPTNVETSDSGVYQQVHTLTKGAHPSYTLQKGIPKLDGSGVETYTFPGSQASSIEFDASANDILKVSLEWMCREVLRDVAYAAPSYPVDAELFHLTHAALTFSDGTLTVPTTTALASITGAATATARTVNVKIEQGLDGEGWNIGGQGRRTRANVVGRATVSGSAEFEFDNEEMADAYLDQTTLSLVLTFTHPSTIGSSSNPVLQIVIPAIRLEGAVPTSAGGDVITVSADYTALEDGTNEMIYVVYRTDDTTV